MFADDIGVVRMADREQVLQHYLERTAVRLVFQALAAFVLDDHHLVVELCLVDGVRQGREAVRFDPEKVFEIS